jgi:rubrerythrin
VTAATRVPPIGSLADLLTAAYRIEADAVTRYELLADQMETHNNPELSATFRDLARAEGIHRDEIRRLAGDIDVAARASKLSLWNRGESPEEADLAAAHYLMTPWHALQLALAAEERALAFFKSVADKATDASVRKMAEEFVEEEAEHVNLVHRLLRKHHPPPQSWSDDPDPPVSQE